MPRLPLKNKPVNYINEISLFMTVLAGFCWFFVGNALQGYMHYISMTIRTGYFIILDMRFMRGLLHLVYPFFNFLIHCAYIMTSKAGFIINLSTDYLGRTISSKVIIEILHTIYMRLYFADDSWFRMTIQTS